MSEISKIKNKSREELTKIILECSSKQEILRRLDIMVKNTQALQYLTNFIKENNIDISHHRMGVPYTNRYKKEDIELLVKDSISWTELIRKLNIKFIGNNITTVKKMVKEFGISIDHFDYVEGARRTKLENGNLGTRKFEDIFCENSDVHRRTAKEYIIKHNLISYQCEKCPLTNEWNGQSLTLHLEHKNGINNDNRLENLCFLCPNCHSQTPSYAGRNVLGLKRSKDGSYIK